MDIQKRNPQIEEKRRKVPLFSPLLLCVLLLLVLSGTAWAQPEPPHSSEEVLFPGLTSEAVDTEVIGTRQRLYIHVSTSELVLQSRDYTIPNKGNLNTWRLRRVDKNGNALGDFLPTQVEVYDDFVTLVVDQSAAKLKAGDRFFVRVHAKKTTTNKEVYLILTSNPVTVDRAHLYSINFGVAPAFNQELENGKRQSLVRFPIRLFVPSLIPQSGASTIYLRSDNRFSTDSRDANSQLELAIGYERFVAPVKRFTYVDWRTELQFKTSQSFKNQAVVLGASLETLIPGFQFRLGNLVRADLKPTLELTPVRYEHRLKQDVVLTPNHAQGDLLVSSLLAKCEKWCQQKNKK